MKIRPGKVEFFPRGPTNRRDEATNSRFPQFCEIV
jgi:hypothetical protein